MCCGPLLDGAPAETPEQLMRSRYTAYVCGHEDHVFRTWHPRTRPADLSVAPDPGWRSLEVLHAAGDVVEFRATHARFVLHETSRFERRGGRWVYVEGELHP